LYKIVRYIFFVSLFYIGVQNNAYTQKSNLLQRDSLDYTILKNKLNSKSQQFSPIIYRNGVVYVSNKQTDFNKIGFNKVYWSSLDELTKIDSINLEKNFNSNNANFKFTSNDNQLLFRLDRNKLLSVADDVEAKFIDFIPEHSFTFNQDISKVIYTKSSFFKYKGVFHWQLWEADLIRGKLKNNRKINLPLKHVDYFYPSLSSDGSILYFSSNMPGGKGGYDIYKIKKSIKGWDKNVENIDILNSAANDIAPVNVNDSFYFASNRDGGIGGYDLYVVDSSNSIKNLGYPINSNSDDLFFAKLDDKRLLVTNRNNFLEIATFKYDPIAIKIKGKLSFKIDRTNSESKWVYILDKENPAFKDSVLADPTGEFIYDGKPNRQYIFHATNLNKLVESYTINTNDQLNKSYLLDMVFSGPSHKFIADSLYALQKQDIINDSIRLSYDKNKYVVFYDFNKSYLLKSETKVLDKLLLDLQKNTNKYIIIGAFTDCVGSYKYNYDLSVKRAQYVLKYLIDRGLSKDRIVSDGYSKQYQITPCSVNKPNKQSRDSRRAEVLLSDTKTTWANIYQTQKNINYTKIIATKLESNTKDSLNKVSIDRKAYKDSVAKEIAEAYAIAVLKKKKEKLQRIADFKFKMDSIRSIEIAVKKTLERQKVINDSIVFEQNILAKKPKKEAKLAKIDSLTKPLSPRTQMKFNLKSEKPKDTIVKVVSKMDENKFISKMVKQQIREEEYTHIDIIKALDSMANLKREQERILSYIQKRINKKPIIIYVASDSVDIEIFDNGIHDKDTVSVLFNNKIIIDKKELKVNKPIKVTVKLDTSKEQNDLVFVADNLGIDPPNTAVMFIRDKTGKRQVVMLSSDMTNNEVVYLIKISKKDVLN